MDEMRVHISTLKNDVRWFPNGCTNTGLNPGVLIDKLATRAVESLMYD